MLHYKSHHTPNSRPTGRALGKLVFSVASRWDLGLLKLTSQPLGKNSLKTPLPSSDLSQGAPSSLETLNHPSRLPGRLRPHTPGLKYMAIEPVSGCLLVGGSSSGGSCRPALVESWQTFAPQVLCPPAQPPSSNPGSWVRGNTALKMHFRMSHFIGTDVVEIFGAAELVRSPSGIGQSSLPSGHISFLVVLTVVNIQA